MCKYVLGVGKKTSNIATYGVRGRYPLYIETVWPLLSTCCTSVKTDSLVKDALQDHYVMFQNKKIVG